MRLLAGLGTGWRYAVRGIPPFDAYLRLFPGALPTAFRVKPCVFFHAAAATEDYTNA